MMMLMSSESETKSSSWMRLRARSSAFLSGWCSSGRYLSSNASRSA